ncbi:MAG: hypothetical protein KH306_07095 [Veillonella sp.]|nr:hypothetical protein [Veillonella sp.]
MATVYEVFVVLSVKVNTVLVHKKFPAATVGIDVLHPLLGAAVPLVELAKLIVVLLIPLPVAPVAPVEPVAPISPFAPIFPTE